MPWAEPIKKELQIGPVRLWPFANKAENKIKEPSVREYLNRYFKLYVDHKGDPVDAVIICSHGDIDFRPLNEQEHKELRNAVDSLIFSIIAPKAATAVCMNNNFKGPPSSEVFQCFTQEFQPGSEVIRIKAGTNWWSWRIDEITFQKPWSAGGSGGTPDRELIEGFNKVFDHSFPKDIRERIFSSLEWFRLAHVESDEVSQLSKLIMMSTAFEILLHFPEFPKEGKKGYFSKCVDKKLASDEFKRDFRINNKGTKFTFSLAGCWAWDFYELRNRIVHGGSIPNKDFIYRDWITHLIVADLIFLECIKRELYQHGCIGEHVRDLALKLSEKNKDEDISELTKKIVPMSILGLGFDEVHRALGWLDDKKVQH